MYKRPREQEGTMRKGWIAGLALVAWGAMCLPAHAVVFRYRPEVGVVTKYKVAIAGRATTTMEGVGETMQMEMTGAISYSEKALSETEDTVRVEQTMTGGQVTAKVEGESQTQEMPKGKFVADMDRRGRLIKVVEADFGGEEGAPDMLSGANNLSSLSSFTVFPEGEVKVGDTWSDSLTIPAMPGSPEIKMKFTSRLLQLTTLADRQVAKIRTNFSGPINLDFPAGEEESAAVQATLEGDMVVYYDYEKSVYVSGEGSVGMDMKVSMPMPEAEGMGMTMKMVMNLKMGLAK